MITTGEDVREFTIKFKLTDKKTSPQSLKTFSLILRVFSPEKEETEEEDQED